MAKEKETTQTKKLSVIDALSAGYQIVGRHIWLVFIPVLVDFWLWFGPKVSAGTSIDGIQKLFNNTPVTFPADYLDMVTKTLAQAKQANLFAVLALSPMGPPSLLGSMGLTSPLLKRPTAWQMVSPAQLTLFIIVAGLIGLLLAALFMVPIAALLRGERCAWSTCLPNVGHSWWQFALFMVFLFLGFIVFSMFIAFLLLIVSLFGSTVMTMVLGLVLLVSSWLALWVMIIFAFVPEAIVLDQANVLMALMRSINVVWRNFWATVFLLVLSMGLMEGFFLIWQRLADNTAGLLIGILGNAYISTGIAVASMLFYRDRFILWQKSASPATSVSTNRQADHKTE